MAVPSERLSRLVSHALRHEPWMYELELDESGWVPVDMLLAAVRTHGPEWSDVDRAALVHMIEASAKRRHEIDGDRIRARYGHSVPGRIALAERVPPMELFHGTSPAAWAVIRTAGLRPMGRQYVHLSADIATAVQVGRRKAAEPVLLRVRAGAAHRAGVRFWHSGDVVWLAEQVPAAFIATGPATR